MTEFVELLNDETSDAGGKDKSSCKNHEGHTHTWFSSMEMTAYRWSAKPTY